MNCFKVHYLVAVHQAFIKLGKVTNIKVIVNFCTELLFLWVWRDTCISKDVYMTLKPTNTTKRGSDVDLPMCINLELGLEPGFRYLEMSAALVPTCAMSASFKNQEQE